MDRVIDYSWERFTPEQIKAIPAIGVVRYLAYGNGGKVIRKDEYDSLSHGGVGIALIWETGETAHLGGYEAGRAHGREARWMADELRHNGVLCAAIDTDISPTEIELVLEYVRGFRDGAHPGGTCSVYGTAYVIDKCVDHGIVEYGYQTNARGWYDNKRVSKHAALLQHLPVDGKYDPNDVLQDYWGQSTGEDMPLSREDIDRVSDAVVRKIQRDVIGDTLGAPKTVANAARVAIRTTIREVFLKKK